VAREQAAMVALVAMVAELVTLTGGVTVAAGLSAEGAGVGVSVGANIGGIWGGSGGNGGSGGSGSGGSALAGNGSTDILAKGKVYLQNSSIQSNSAVGGGALAARLLAAEAELAAMAATPRAAST